MKRSWLVAASVASALVVNVARADVIADINGSTVGGVTTAENQWQNYVFTFAATQAVTTIGLLIRNDPNFMGLDNLSVTSTPSGANLLTNPDLETAPDANSGLAPSGWYTIGTQGLNAHGVWENSTGEYSAQSGSGFWYDGAVGGHDGIAQDISTVAGQTYTLSFWLITNPVPDGSNVDYQVLAGSLPDGVTVTSGTPGVTDAPEPMTLGVVLPGLAGLAVARRKRMQRGQASA